VVDNCASLQVRTQGRLTLPARVVARDAGNDLAVMGTGTPSQQFAMLRTSPARAGESVTAIGFPLTGLLASGANVSTGTVSATAGLQNDITKLQISAPLQSGNSGGPLLDESAALLGVIVSKLNALSVAKITGDIPQNVNFAIKSDVVRLLLDANDIKYSMARLDAKKSAAADVAERAKQYTVLVECN
jgi:S1-C subfamily serine protease